MTPVGLNQSILDSIAAGVVVLNQYGRIVSANAAWSQMALDNGLALWVRSTRPGTRRMHAR